MFKKNILFSLTLVLLFIYWNFAQLIPNQNNSLAYNFNIKNSDNGTRNLIIIKMPTRQQMENFYSKQLAPPTVGSLLNQVRLPCTCQNGLCGCCTGMLLQTFRTKGCVNITYMPEDFAFELKMLMNDHVLYKNKLTGRNPPPVCVHPPRFPFIEVCANFHDVYFIGRNIHVCLDLNGNFQGFELFSRSFDCMRLGNNGVKIVKPEDGPGLPNYATDADVDAGGADIEDYDENLVRLFNF